MPSGYRHSKSQRLNRRCIDTGEPKMKVLRDTLLVIASVVVILSFGWGPATNIVGNVGALALDVLTIAVSTRDNVEASRVHCDKGASGHTHGVPIRLGGYKILVVYECVDKKPLVVRWEVTPPD